MTSNEIKQQRLTKNIYDKLHVNGLRYLPDCNLLKKVLMDISRGKLISFVIASQGEYLFALRTSSYKDRYRRRHITIKGSEINPFSKNEHDDQGYCQFIIDDKKGIAYMGENPDRIDIISGVYLNMGVGSAMLILALEEAYKKGIREFIIYHPRLLSYPFYEQFYFKRNNRNDTLKLNLCELFTTENNERIKWNERICQIMERRNITFIDMHEYTVSNGSRNEIVI